MLRERILGLCKERNINISNLENTLGLAKSTISKWDKSSPKAENLQKIADYFGVPVDYLTGKMETLSPTPEELQKIFPGGKFDLQLFSDKGPMPPDDETIQKALAILKEMDEEHKKAALLQLEALAALNRK